MYDITVYGAEYQKNIKINIETCKYVYSINK